MKDALHYLKNYIIKESVLKKPNRAETERICNYPYAVVEEILANAVYHRSYQINEPIAFCVTPDAKEIISFPGFDRSIPDEKIARGDIWARIYRNRRIGDCLKELKLTPGRNTGFPNARKALSENGSGLLSFDMNPDRGYLSDRIPIHGCFQPKDTESGKKEECRQKILRLLEGTPTTLTELSRVMGGQSIFKKLSTTVDEMVKLNLLQVTFDGRKTLYSAGKREA